MGCVGTLEELKGRRETATATTSTNRKELPELTQVMWRLKQNGMPFAIWRTMKTCGDISTAKTIARPFTYNLSNEDRYVLWTFIEREIAKSVYVQGENGGEDLESVENEIDPVTGKHKWFKPVKFPKRDENKQ